MTSTDALSKSASDTLDKLMPFAVMFSKLDRAIPQGSITVLAAVASYRHLLAIEMCIPAGCERR